MELMFGRVSCSPCERGFRIFVEAPTAPISFMKGTPKSQGLLLDFYPNGGTASTLLRAHVTTFLRRPIMNRYRYTACRLLFGFETPCVPLRVRQK